MIAVKLLSVVVQPVFVLVDIETGDVEPGPQIAPATIKASQIGELDALLDAARKQIEEQVQT